MSDLNASQGQEAVPATQSQASTTATGASASKWRHQESGRYHRHARDATGSSTNTSSLAAFLNSSRVEGDGNGDSGAGGHKPIEVDAADANDGKEIVCGPLLNYQRTVDGCWHGSVLIVVSGGGLDVTYQPSMHLQKAAKKDAAAAAAGAPTAETSAAAEDVAATAADAPAAEDPAAQAQKPKNPILKVEGERLYSDKRNTFWTFHIEVPVEAAEARYEYGFADMRIKSADKPRINAFSVPAADESMRIMFHSCNGFSVGTDEDAYSGAPLWNDVMRKHEAAPFHAMLGGGDQIYNDGIRVNGPLRAWTDISNPKKRAQFPFNEKLRADCDQYYLDNYIRWYNTAPFCYANGQIPQINIWDDHDIIDGFGSYVDRFMRCDVFRGIGGTAQKYYLLFQHHMAPPKSTYTSDHKGNGPDPAQTEGVFVAEPNVAEQYIVGAKPGPYVEERSFNMYTRLGARMAMLGIDARTERTRRQVNYPETYKLIFDRLRSELKAAASTGQPIQHLILLLGIPIAYPRLAWLENILRSPLIGPIKFLNRRFGIGGGFFNHFDGSVDLLDDLDDHYTAKTHKVERRELITTLQGIAAEYSVRVTILGGDVHLAALGRFYANPKSKVPVEEDHRYMANVVSSAIVNKPPPQTVANLLARRNKIHHLDDETDETLLDLFNRDPGSESKTAGFNHCTMPSRNFAMLRENSPNNPALAESNGDASSISFAGRDGHKQMHRGEVGAGTEHRAATDGFGMANDGSLDIRINVEIDQHSSEGKTQAYGLSVPTLKSTMSSSTAPVLPPVASQDRL